jgi:hypothetical protein
VLTEAQKSNVRRHLDYPVAGLLKSSPAGGSLASPFAGYRFFQTYGRLEWKLNNLNADEEARLLGVAYGAVTLIGPNPNVGDSISITLQGGSISSPQTLVATTSSGDSSVTLAQRLVVAAVGNTVLQAAQLLVLTPFGTGPFNQNELPLAEVAFEAPAKFQITSPTGSGMLVPQVVNQGDFLAPTTSIDGVTQLWGFLPILDGLEGAWASASQNLDTQRAGPWYGRRNEIGQRLALYRNWQIRLSRFLEIPLYDGTPEGARRAEYASTTRYA